MRISTKRLTITGFCIGLGLVLPTLFHLALGGVVSGTALLPMHIPVLLCGFLAGRRCGAFCGVMLPLLSSALTGMPALYPQGISMVFELAAYGWICGALYMSGRGVYPSLVVAMLGGRAVSGIAKALLLGFADKPFAVGSFLTTSFVTALPGIAIQLAFIPLIVKTLERARLAETPAHG